ncbi:MAG: hypothetical protein ACE5NC_04210 [Anaerolineae bacterium]
MQESRSAGFGRFLAIRARWAAPRFWLGPSVAVLCGAIAGNGLRLEAAALTRLVLTILLADGIWGALWREARSAVSVFYGAAPLRLRVYPRPPYATAGSAADRWSRWVAERRRRWERAPMEGRDALLGIGVLGLASLALGVLLGPGPLLITLAAGLILLLSLARSFRGGAPRIALHALYSGGLAWVLGFAISSPGGGLFDPDSPAALPRLAEIWGWTIVWAGVFTATLYGSRQLAQGEDEQGFGFLVGGQAAGAVALLAGRQPLLAGAVGLLLVPQLLLRPALLRGRGGPWYLSRVRVYPVVSMLAGAVAVAS